MEHIVNDVSDTEDTSADEHDDGKHLAVHFKLEPADDVDSDNQSKDQLEYNHADQSKMSETGQSIVLQADHSDRLENDQSENLKMIEEGSSLGKSPTYMVRSETDDFCQIHYTQTINICDVAAESIKWLSHRLGPLLTAKYLSKNLVRMLALCYLGEEQVAQIPETGMVTYYI